MTVTTQRVDLAAVRNGSEPVLTIADPLPLRSIATSAIRTTGGTQMRAALDDDTIMAYAEVLDEHPGAWPFPPIVLFDDGEALWLADGFHRVAAAAREQSLRLEIPADIRQGSRRDAILYAAGANASHGLRRTGADKRRAMEALLRDEEWGKWSNTEIARRCQVSEGTVRTLRGVLERTSQITKSIARKSADGRTINVGNIGIKPAAAPITQQTQESQNSNLATVAEIEVYVRQLTCTTRALREACQRDSQYYLTVVNGLRRDGKRWDSGEIQLAFMNVANERDAATRLDDLPIVANNGSVASSATGSRQQGSPLGKCSVCSRPLYDPAQAAQGMGACCAAKQAAGAGDGTHPLFDNDRVIAVGALSGNGDDTPAEQAETLPALPTDPTWAVTNPRWVSRDGLLPDGRVASLEFRIFNLKQIGKTFSSALTDLGAWAEATGHHVATLEAERGLQRVIELNEHELQSLGAK